MAARASVDAMDADGSDRVHVVTGCGFRKVYGSDARGLPSFRPDAHDHGGGAASCSEDGRMETWIRLSRSIVMVIGVGSLLLAGGNLVTGGGSISDPVMPGGVALGLGATGAGMWTTDGGRFRALVVWLGLIGILVALAVAWISTGDMQTRDLLLYVGVPSLAVLAAVGGVAVGRMHAGAFG
jgi:hypothetical protein